MCGSCAPGVDGAAEVVNIRPDGTVERAECDENIPTIPAVEEEAVLGESFLDTGVLCGHGRTGCGQNTEVCSLSGEKGTGSRTVAIV